MKLVNVIAGGLGGLVSGLISKNVTWPERITSCIVGAITAGYGTPVAMPIVRKWLDLWSYPNGEIEGAVGYALGLCGMTACTALIRWVKRWRDGPPEMPKR